MNSERDLAKVREDMRELEGRLKWTQSKLRMEMDAYKVLADPCPLCCVSLKNTHSRTHVNIYTYIYIDIYI